MMLSKRKFQIPQLITGYSVSKELRIIVQRSSLKCVYFNGLIFIKISRRTLLWSVCSFGPVMGAGWTSPCLGGSGEEVERVEWGERRDHKGRWRHVAILRME